MSKLPLLLGVLSLAAFLLLGGAPPALAATHQAGSTDAADAPSSHVALVGTCSYAVAKWQANPHLPVLGRAPGAAATHPAVVGTGAVTIRGNVSCARPMVRIKLETLTCNKSNPCGWKVQNQTTFVLLPVSGTVPLRISAPALLGTHSYRVEIEERHTEMGIYLSAAGQHVKQLRTSGKNVAGGVAKLTG